MTKPKLGLSLMCEPAFLQATFPLFSNAEIEVIEWSFDTILHESAEPEWLNPLLSEFSEAGRLIGHGVHFSTLDAAWNQKQIDWLEHLKKCFQKNQYQHLTEHFGFMSSVNAHSGCPLPISLDERSLSLGHDRLKRLQEAAEVPVGLENLALSFSIKDVNQQGEFLEKLVEPVNGFLIMDIHNLYCQSYNFNVPLNDLIDAYPTHLVKEIHISGGSWQESIYGDQKVRRDTHNEAVPQEVFDGFEYALSVCPHLEYVILERLGNSFNSEKDAEENIEDYHKLRGLIDQSASKFEHKNWGNKVAPSVDPFESSSLYQEQRHLHDLFIDAKKLVDVKQTLSEKYDISNWNEEMINTAVILTKKWD